MFFIGNDGEFIKELASLITCIELCWMILLIKLIKLCKSCSDAYLRASVISSVVQNKLSLHDYYPCCF
jgi:hypothetical protein